MSLIVTWHPTYAFFHNPYEWGAFECDLQRFGRLIHGGLASPPKKLLTKPTPQDVLRICQKRWVAIDIETGPRTKDTPWTGKDPTLAKLRTVGFGNDDWGLSWDFELEWNEPMFRMVQRVLAAPNILKVLHNGPWFDNRVLRRYRMPVRNYIDTRDMRRALSSTSPLKLSYVASLYNDTNDWKHGGEEDDEKGIVFTDNREDLKKYNAQDCFETGRGYVGMVAEPEWQTKRVQRIYSVHAKLSRIAAKMHSVGFTIDQEDRARLDTDLLKLFEKRKRKLHEAVGIAGFKCNPNSMRSLIYSRHETQAVNRFHLPDPVDPLMWVDKKFKTCAVDQSALLLLLVEPATPPELKRIIELYWHAMSVQKARSTYVVSKKVEYAIGPDGRLRPGWNSCGTDTMRWSCNSPNLQNLSEKKDEDGGALQGNLPTMRSMYVAGTGKVLVHADYSQLELRVMAAVAGDDELQRRLDAGDVYSADAKDWFGLPADMDVKAAKPAARKQSKIIHLASQYAAGTEAIFMQGLEQDRSLKFPVVRELHHAFKTTYRQTVEYWFEEQKRVAECGYSEGRILRGRRTYPREPPITEVANYPIQRTAAELANLSMIDLDERLQSIKGANIITQLHDAFDVECFEDDADGVKALMKECMEQPRIIEGKARHFPVDIKVGTRWSTV